MTDMLLAALVAAVLGAVARSVKVRDRRRRDEGRR